MVVADFLALSRITSSLQAGSKKALLKALAEIGATECGLPVRKVFQTLCQRENACGTGMGGGVAVPHGRFEQLSQVVEFFIRLQTPVAFDAPDGKPVDLVFMLLSPAKADTQHLKALGAVSKLMRNQRLTQALRAASDAEAIYRILQGAPTHD